MIYLASPYTHANPEVRKQRFEAVCAAAGKMMARGKIVFSPIAHSHPVSETMDISPIDHDFWLRQCFGVLRFATELHVLRLDGWESSRGVNAEVQFAGNLGIPVYYVDP